jgi:probable F420-dependent oxidoreductase
VRFGLHALGVGPGSDPDVVAAAAVAAERRGFSTLWAGEHVVMVDDPDTPYPYADDGRIALPSDVDWLDPLAVLAFAAAVTSRVRLATGILLLPEHQPVAVAKRVASLDVLSKGRFVLGVGIGWSAAEFAALGVPFDGRAARTREYVAALRTLWADDVSSYDGTSVRFDRVRSYPKPLGRQVPVVVGGNSDRALARVAAWGDGWYGFNVPVADVPGRLAVLRAECHRERRDPGTVDVAVALADGSPGDVAGLDRAGVDEIVLVETPPADAVDVDRWVTDLADRWGVAGTR